METQLPTIHKMEEIIMAENKVKTIGVLTSGGDAPGMNAAIRAVVRTALGKGLKVRGIRRGYSGLLNEEIIDLSARDVSDTIQRGGTILLTARCEEMRTPEGQQKAAAICKKYGIDGLVVIGGDGSFKGAQKLSDFGVNTIGLPGTIDLDIACTEYTIGFDTAVNTAMLGFRNEQLIAILVMLGSATTVSSFVMARNMGHEGTLSSGVIMMTTLLSAFTLTMWLDVLRSFGLV